MQHMLVHFHTPVDWRLLRKKTKKLRSRKIACLAISPFAKTDNSDVQANLRINYE